MVDPPQQRRGDRGRVLVRHERPEWPSSICCSDPPSRVAATGSRARFRDYVRHILAARQLGKGFHAAQEPRQVRPVAEKKELRAEPGRPRPFA